MSPVFLLSLKLAPYILPLTPPLANSLIQAKVLPAKAHKKERDVQEWETGWGGSHCDSGS
jgi:hypothetical protein